jgi:hypothetical protein
MDHTILQPTSLIFFKGKMILDILLEWPYAGRRCFEQLTEEFPVVLA